MKTETKNCIRPDCLCDNRHDLHHYKNDEIPDCICGGVNCKPLSSLDKAFDKLKRECAGAYDITLPPEVLKFVCQRENDLLEKIELILIDEDEYPRTKALQFIWKRKETIK